MKLLRTSLALTLAVGAMASLPLQSGHALAAAPRVAVSVSGGQSPSLTTATFLRTTSPVSMTATSASARASTQRSTGAVARELGPQKPEGDRPVNPNASPPSGLSVPSVTGSAFATSASSASRVAPNAATTILVNGFDGLSHRDQRFADNGNQFSLEPPDQALCVGGGFVLESVNDALRVYNRGGTPASGVTSLNQFFTGTSEIIRGKPSVFGPSVGDPRCFYDSATERFFVSVYEQTINPATDGGFGTLPTNLLVAVSQTSDPRGAYNVYQINTTNDGGNCNAGRPCFPDYPQIGADANGFYINSNAFFFGNTTDITQTFEGAQLYAFPKTLLEAPVGAAVPGAHFAINPLQEDGFTIQPAQPAPGEAGDASNGGTMYYLSSLDPNQTAASGIDNRLAIWALSNTSALTTNPLNTSLKDTVFTGQTYATPTMGSQQRNDGIRPLGTGLYDPTGNSTGISPTVQRTPQLDTGDDRVQQVTYAAGMLWAGLNTAVNVTGGGTTSNQTGVAYFILTPSAPGGTPMASIVNQGLLGFQGIDAFYPSIGVNSATGAGVMTFAASGPTIYPSPAYIPIDASGLASTATVPVEGNSSDDGFTGYTPYSRSTPPTGRWGDYSQAATDSNGSVWLAQEYIAATPCDPRAPSPGCGQRSVFANWGTRITNVTPITNLPPGGGGAPTPELGSGELLSTGLLVLGGLVLVRRRRARRATPEQDDPTA